MEPIIARRMWKLTEPYHAVVYFAPEAREHFQAIGLKGFWMGYFASRAAALGPEPAEVVVATFYGFHPAMVKRAIPDAWSYAAPEAILAARLDATDAALRRLLGDWVASEAEEAAGLIRRAAGACDPAGRPLYAAHASLVWPEAAHLVLWHGSTLLREHRGDGHVASLLAAGLSGCEAHVTLAATGKVPVDILRPNRGWSEEEWRAAADRLVASGLMGGDGCLSDAGQAVRDQIEANTDMLALPPWQHLGEEGCTRLAELMAQPVRRIVAEGALPFPTPMGLPAS
ncbi:MAG: SCO6745 family protein [Acidimicrobiales bacterium]